MVAKAGTILIPSGPAHDPGRMHLHVVCSDPCENGQQLVVSITSWVNSLCDDACIIEAHEHSFLKHKSYVLYRRARIEKATDLDSGIVRQMFRMHAPVNAQTFLRIKNGICKSRQHP